MGTILEQKEYIQYLAYQHFHNDDIFFIGRNVDYALSLEGSLKLKEISYIHSEAYPSGELKHGTISLITDGTPVIALITDRALAKKSLVGVHEVISRGARAIIITSAEIAQDDGPLPCEQIVLPPSTRSLLLPFAVATAVQLLAYFVSAEKGLDVDKPRNLAKSVTVE